MVESTNAEIEKIKGMTDENEQWRYILDNLIAKGKKIMQMCKCLNCGSFRSFAQLHQTERESHHSC